MAEHRHEKCGLRLRDGHAGLPWKQMPLLGGLAVSLLMHGIALWFVLHREALMIEASGNHTEHQLTVMILPSSASTPAQQRLAQQASSEPQFALQNRSHAAAAKQQQRKLAQGVQQQTPDATQALPRAPVPKTARSDSSLPEDLFSQVEAARKRRAEAAQQAGMQDPAVEPSAPDAAKSDHSVALSNIEFSLRRAKGKDQDDVGGVFQVRRVGYREAEFVFHGWSERSRRNATRLITVEQGSSSDIQSALVQKVIEIIREEKKADFLWESRRLGKPITLSARPEDYRELEQFLMQEFFP